MVIESKTCVECNKAFKENEYKKYKINYGDLYPICFPCWLELMGIKDLTHARRNE